MKDASLVTLYHYSKVDKEWVFNMSCKVINGLIHSSIINEIQACNNAGLKTKIIYS